MKEFFKSRFISPGKGLLVKNLIEYLEDELLKFDTFPEDYLLFIEEIFSNEDLFSAKKSWKILHFLPSENLSQEQFNELSLTICDNFYSYSEYMLCDLSCDFIARTCCPEFALELFEKLIDHDVDDIHRRSLLVGLNILLTHGFGDNAQCRERAKMLADRISVKKDSGTDPNKTPK